MESASDLSENSEHENALTLQPEGRRTRDRSNFIDSIFCHGVASYAESAPSMRSEGDIQQAKFSDKISRFGRTPLKSMDVLNKKSGMVTVTPPSPKASSCGFTEAISVLIHSGKPLDRIARTDICDCNGASNSCWDTQSNRPLALAPSTRGCESNSIPAIEALGVTPKSKARHNKYSCKTKGMNSPGIAIPTPAVVRKKFTPAFGNIPETIQATHYLEMEKVEGEDTEQRSVVISVVPSVSEDAFLPEDFPGTNENQRLYTEADLKAKIAEALGNQKTELEMKFASSSESDVTSKDLQLKLQAQLEEQGKLWNKDLQERLEENRSHYRNQRSVLKSRIAELEEKCKTLKTSKEEDRRRHQRQTEQLRLEMNRVQEADSAESPTKIATLTQQIERISCVTKSNSSLREQPCTPRFIRDLEQKLRSLQTEKELLASRETELKQQIIGLQEQVISLEKSLCETQDRCALDQHKVANLESQIERLETEGHSLRSDLVVLGKRLSSRDSDVTTTGLKFMEAVTRGNELEKTLDETTQQDTRLKEGLQRCIRLISANPNIMHSELSSPYDESNCLDSLEALQQLVKKLSDRLEESEQRVKQSEEDVRKETDSRVAAELEVAALSAMLESQNPEDEGIIFVTSAEDLGIVSVRNHKKDCSDLEGIAKVNSFETPLNKASAKKHGDRTPARQRVKVMNSYLNIITSEMLTQLKGDIEALKRIMPTRCDNPSIGGINNESQLLRLIQDDAWLLPKDAVDVLNKLVDDIYEQLKHLQEQYGRQYAHSATQTSSEEGNLLVDSNLLEHLEHQKHALANKEKEHWDEVRKVHLLTEELELIRSKHNPVAPDENCETQSKGQRDDSTLSQELDKLNAKLSEAEASTNLLKEEVATKRAEKAEIILALGLSQEQATMLEKGLVKLMTSHNTEEKVLVRQEIKGKLEQHFADSLNRDEKQIQELLVMLQLKQDNEKLTTTVEKQEKLAESMQYMKEELEQQVSDLTSTCQILRDDHEQKDNTLVSLREEAARRKVRQAIFEQKLDSIISHIEMVESEQGVVGEHVSAVISTESANDASPMDMQKLNKIEHHLLYVWDDFTRKKVVELSNQRQLLSSMKESIAKHKAESQTTIAELQSKVDESDRILEEERQKSCKTIHELDARVIGFERDFESMQEVNEQALQKLRIKISELENGLEEKTREVKAATLMIESLEVELSEALDVVSESNEQSKQGFQSIITAKEKTAALATEVDELRHKVSSLENQIVILTNEKANLEASGEKQEECGMELESVLSECARLEERLEMAKTESTNQGNTIKNLESQLETCRSECERLEKVAKMRSGSIEEELLKRTAELEAQAQATIRNCEAQVRKVREDHANEIDELLSQLDLVEAEHTASSSEQDKALKGKDTIIAALGAQLAEIQNRLSALEKSSSEQLRALEESREDMRLAKQETETWKSELEYLQAVHTKVLESELDKRKAAVEEAREETIREATDQFDNFNALYRTMTQHYKSAAARVKELETELLASQQALEELSKDRASKLETLSSQLEAMRAGE
jgi:hypothetical protein